MTVRLFVRHTVSDYYAWRRIYDNFDAERRTMGVIKHTVFRSADDGNDITVTHDFVSLETARAFLGSDRVRDVMGEAGVVGEPQTWFGEPA